MPLLPPAAPGSRRFTLAAWQLAALADGTASVDVSQVGLARPAQELAPLLEAAGLTSPVTISSNTYRPLAWNGFASTSSGYHFHQHLPVR